MKNSRTTVLIAIIAISSALLITATSLAQVQQQVFASNSRHNWKNWWWHNHDNGQRARASIEQENSQRGVCISGSSTIGSCNQLASNFNSGNVVAANVGGSGHHSGSQSSSASISQENDQDAVCISGSSTIGSCNQLASNFNSGNVVSANVR
jgi:hypothetical protein